MPNTDLRHRLSGIITVLNTPFTDDDRIDVPSLERNVERAVEAGVAGFLLPAMASEVGRLTTAERELLVSTVVTATQGRAPVIGGASATTQEERLQHTETMLRLGCDGVLVSLPFENEAQYEQAVRGIAAVGPAFLMLQDWDASGYGVPVPLITRLFEDVPAFQSLKIEVVPAGVKYSEVLAATGGRLHIAGGWAVMQMIEAFDRGVHSIMPTGMHRIYTTIYRLYQAGKREQAQTLFRRLLPVLAFSNQHLDISIHFFKRLLQREGVYTTARVREPLLPFDAVHERIADELIALVLRLTDELITRESV